MAGLNPRTEYNPNPSVQEYLDTLGRTNIANYGDPQEYIRSLVGEMYPLRSLSEGITNEVDMGPDPYQGNPNEYSDELYQLAGGRDWDKRTPPPLPIVPMSPGIHPLSPYEDYNYRVQNPGAGRLMPLRPVKPGERLGSMTPFAGEQDYIDQLLAGNPEEGDPYQVAGDVVPLPMRPGASFDDVRRRGELNNRRPAGSYGQQSIEQFGGRHSPYLDLMDVLMGRFPPK
jgi:hypothetical protein